MNTKIKICGLRRPEDIDYVNALRPDYVGFVFCEKSSRHVTLDQALALSRRLDPKLVPVGVFLDNSIEEIEAVAASGAVEILQLHGAKQEQIERLKEATGLPIWEAIQVKDEEDIRRAQASKADIILLDSKSAGSGQSFDWSLLKGLGRDFMLAGGLHAGNIKEALACKPYGVDTSSGVETEKRKDYDKIKEFIELVRSEEEK